MIPDDMIKKAKAAYINKRRKTCSHDSLIAALEAVAARIWDDGHIAAGWNCEEVCRCAAWEPGECACGNYGNGHRIKRNPCKASED